MSAGVTALRGDGRSGSAKMRSMCSIVTIGGCDTYRTPALSTADARWFQERGFVTVQSLVVLQHDGSIRSDVSDTINCRDVTCRQVMLRPQRQLLAAVLAIDAESFAAPWNLSRETLRHACRATSEHRILVAHGTPDTVPLGYAIVGRVGMHAYLQRLAVGTAQRRRGVAKRLVHDAARWAATRGATTMLVNTEPANDAARALYRTLGFVLLPDPLVVLERAVHPPEGAHR